MADRLLTTGEAAAYWDTRHRRAGDLASGGHIGLDRAGNEMFYARRLGTLLELIGDQGSPDEPMFVLDAGCGKGQFARALARCGHRVDAIDASGPAIGYARAAGFSGAPPRWSVCTLDQWDSPWLYDAVYSIDVLFHILDDGTWRRSLDNLASLVRFGGTLVVTDSGSAQRHRRGNYIVHRPRAAYLARLLPRGFTCRGFRPYGFRGNEVGFHVFTRTR